MVCLFRLTLILCLFAVMCLWAVMSGCGFMRSGRQSVGLTRFRCLSLSLSLMTVTVTSMNFLRWMGMRGL
jgi:hypothetical protein